MNNTQIRAELITRLSQWADHPIQYYGFPNSPAVDAAKANGEPWVACIMRPTPARNASIGNGPVPRRPGGLFLQVFVKPNSGIAESVRALQIADSLAAHMENERMDGVVTEAANVIVVGEQDGWYQANVNIPYRTTI